jgi:hypothetical protein
VVHRQIVGHWVGILSMPRRMAYFDLHAAGSAQSGH